MMNTMTTRNTLTSSVLAECVQLSEWSQRHPERAVQPNDLPVDHGVLDDGLHQVGELGRVTQALREGDRRRKERLHLLGQTSQQWRVKQTWRRIKQRFMLTN